MRVVSTVVVAVVLALVLALVAVLVVVILLVLVDVDGCHFDVVIGVAVATIVADA